MLPIKNRTLLHEIARETSTRIFGKSIYQRGIIEISNICKNDCFYCGIRNANKIISRYEMTKNEILVAAQNGYDFGIRTFVLQSGERDWELKENESYITEVIRLLKSKFSDSAVTLSLGESSYSIYKKWFDAGADRYLLRHETGNERHYKKLHPKEMKLKHRIEALQNLKKIGYQTGMGFMVGSPFQTASDLAEDLKLIEEIKPEMVGIGPFIPHGETEFKNFPAGTVEKTLDLIAILRIKFPRMLLPATTALGTVDGKGREKGILAGANVVMFNLTSEKHKDKYLLYDNKICIDEDIKKCSSCMNDRIRSIGYELSIGRGDWK